MLSTALLTTLVAPPLIAGCRVLARALAARPAGFRLTAAGLGAGPPAWRRQRGGLVLWVGRWPGGPRLDAVPLGPEGPRHLVWHGAGLLAQLALAAMLLLLAGDHELAWAVAGVDLGVAAALALPWTVAGVQSDGAALLDLCLGGRRGRTPLARRAVHARAARRAAVAGDREGEAWANLHLAWAALLADRADELALWSPAAPTDPDAADHPFPSPWPTALAAWIRAEWHRAEGRAFVAARLARETARALPGPDPASAALLAVAEARALVELGSIPAAQRALARAVGVGGDIGLQASVVLLLTELPAQGGGTTAELEAATWRVLRGRHGRFLDPADAALALSLAADRLDAEDRGGAGFAARLAASEIARRSLSALTATDRAGFASRLRGGRLFDSVVGSP